MYNADHRCNRPLSRRKGTRASEASSQGHAHGDVGSDGLNLSLRFCNPHLKPARSTPPDTPPKNHHRYSPPKPSGTRIQHRKHRRIAIQPGPEPVARRHRDNRRLPPAPQQHSAAHRPSLQPPRSPAHAATRPRVPDNRCMPGNTHIVDARTTSHNINFATISASSATPISAVPADTTRTPPYSGATPRSSAQIAPQESR